jgi:tetrahydromethanopterin S-methyltransferase subunit G
MGDAPVTRKEFAALQKRLDELDKETSATFDENINDLRGSTKIESGPTTGEPT